MGIWKERICLSTENREKSLMQECAIHIERTAGRPQWLEHSDRVEGK